MQRGGRPHTKKVESLLSPGEKVESRYGPAEASIITMVEAQAAESSRKGGFVCRTHASTRTVLARRMGPGGAGAVRGRAEPSPQDSNPNSWEIGARNEGPRAGGWCPLLRSGKAPAPPRLAGILSGRVDARGDPPTHLARRVPLRRLVPEHQCARPRPNGSEECGLRAARLPETGALGADELSFGRY